MPARTGEQYIKGLQQQEREVWLGGERVKDVTTHPGLANGVRSVAALYDMQHDPTLRDEMTYVSPTTGDRVGLSFIIPRTKLELELRRTMMLHWARATCGMVGRSPDFMNVTFAAWSAAAEYFGRGRPEFARNIRRYYEHISENDLTLTHSLINLQRSRTISGVFNLQEGTALQVKRETGAGIVVNGARVLATLGPLADEIAVYSPRLARHTEPHSPFALRPPAGLALRGDGLRRLLRRRAGALGAGVPAGRRGPAQRHGDDHAFRRAHGSPERGEEPGQVRVRPRCRAADDGDAGQRPASALGGAAG